MSTSQLADINNRLFNLEQKDFQDVLTLLEIVSNATFFGEMKRNICEYSKEGQCSFFSLKEKARNKLPLASQCRIKDCEDQSEHYHIELSNITCTLCPLWLHSKPENILNRAPTEGTIT